MKSVNLKCYEAKFNSLNVDDSEEHWILVSSVKAQVLTISISNDQRYLYEIENAENRTIVDFDLYQDFISVLYDKNEIQVFNISTKENVFRTIVKDSTDLVTGIFYVPNFDLPEEDLIDFSDNQPLTH